MNFSNRQMLQDNRNLYDFYFNRLRAMALAQFNWKNLPDGCNAKYFEEMLLTRGTAAIYRVAGTDLWLSTGYIQHGQLNAYGYPADIRGIGQGTGQITPDQWEICYDNTAISPNYQASTLMSTIQLFAELMFETHMTLRLNIQQQGTPYIIKGTKDTALSVRNLALKILGRVPLIEIKDKMKMEDIGVLDLKVPFISKDMLDVMDRIWSTALGAMGIASPSDKRERMITPEVSMSMQSTRISALTRLKPRLDFVELINDKYALDIEVELSENMDTALFSPENIIGGESNGQLHMEHSGNNGAEGAGGESAN